jgi:hypothetical protein
MNRRRWVPDGGAVIGLFIVFALAGCERQRPSPIVELVQNAGAGDLRTAMTGSIVHWFDKHLDVSLEADRLCKPKRANAPAPWPTTAEGRVCDAAAQLAGMIQWQRDLHRNADHKTFQGGSK